MDERFAAYWARAEEMDKWDSLKSFREQFFIPPGTVYMDGNSLGLPPKAAEDALEKTFGEWRDLAIGGWAIHRNGILINDPSTPLAGGVSPDPLNADQQTLFEVDEQVDVHDRPK